MPPTELRVVRLRCLSNVHATQFRSHLARRGVVCDRIEDADVFVGYHGNLAFVSRIAAEAVLHNYAAPEVMSGLIGEASAVEEVLALVG